MERVWWEKIPKAAALINDIADSMLDGRSLVLQSAGSVPWQDVMQDRIEEEVLQHNSNKTFEHVDTAEDPGAYLLDHFCRNEKRVQYRPTKSYARFLGETEDIVLHDRYFWITAESEDVLNAWMDFTVEYNRRRPRNANCAAFCVLWSDPEPMRPKKGITFISFEEYISDFDRVAFSMLAASSAKEKTEVKKYLAELTASIAGNDMELAAECIENYRELLKDTESCLENIIENKVRSNGKPFTLDMDSGELKRATWLAQIKTIYPLTEEFRENFVEQHRSAIDDALPVTTKHGTTYTKSEDVELGALVFMIGDKKMFVTENEYKTLIKYLDARNKLSHLCALTFEEITGLI